jgi:hypothetical protein
MAESKNDAQPTADAMDLKPRAARAPAQTVKSEIKYLAKHGNLMVEFPNRAVTFTSVAPVALTTEELASSAFKKYENRLQKVEVPVEV